MPSTLQTNLRAARTAIRNAHRELIFNRALSRFADSPAAALNSARSLLADLVYGWGNEAWSASHEFLAACIEAALSTRSAILECGSGLTTLLLGIVAQQRGIELWALEHLPSWADRVEAQLAQRHVGAVRVHVSPLRDYGEFDWYDPPLDEMPSHFGLVVCDGPPSATRGGRYGLCPVMRDRFAADGLILVDDAERLADQAVVRRWADEMPCRVSTHGIEKPFFELQLQRRPARN